MLSNPISICLLPHELRRSLVIVVCILILVVSIHFSGNLRHSLLLPPLVVYQFNFVGRILGPDGSTAKCLQQCLGVKLMVRGRGSMRDRKKVSKPIPQIPKGYTVVSPYYVRLVLLPKNNVKMILI